MPRNYVARLAYIRCSSRNFNFTINFLILFKVEHKIEQLRAHAQRIASLKKLSEVETLFNELDAMKWTISDRQNQIRSKAQDVIARIKQQEPPEAGVQDIEKLKRAIDSLSTNFELFWSQTITKIEEYRRTCTFSEDLERIETELQDLNEHLKKVDAKIGENLQTAKATATSFVQFEKTVTVRTRNVYTIKKILYIVNYNKFIILFHDSTY